VASIGHSIRGALSFDTSSNSASSFGPDTVILKPWSRFGDLAQEQAFLLIFANNGRKGLICVVVMQVVYVIFHAMTKDISYGYDLPIVAGLNVVRTIILSFTLTHPSQKYVSTFLTFCALYVWFGSAAYYDRAGGSANCWVFPSVILELVSLQYCGLILWEITFGLLIVLLVPCAILEYHAESTRGAKEEVSGLFTTYCFQDNTFPLVLTTHVFFLCTIFWMLSYWKEVQGRREFLYQERLFNENIKFRLAANPFTAANLGNWFMEQFANPRSTFSTYRGSSAPNFKPLDEVRVKTGKNKGQLAIIRHIEPSTEYLTIVLKSGKMHRRLAADVELANADIPSARDHKRFDSATELRPRGSSASEYDEFGYRLMDGDIESNYGRSVIQRAPSVHVEFVLCRPPSFSIFVDSRSGSTIFTSSGSDGGKNNLSGSHLSHASSLDVVYRESIRKKRSDRSSQRSDRSVCVLGLCASRSSRSLASHPYQASRFTQFIQLFIQPFIQPLIQPLVQKNTVMPFQALSLIVLPCLYLPSRAAVIAAPRPSHRVHVMGLGSLG
jgi:hypothetical protein